MITLSFFHSVHTDTCKPYWHPFPNKNPQLCGQSCEDVPDWFALHHFYAGERGISVIFHYSYFWGPTRDLYIKHEDLHHTL